MRNEQLIKKQSIPHDSATKHVSGFADYTDDISEPLNTLHGAIAVSYTHLTLPTIYSV